MRTLAASCLLLTAATAAADTTRQLEVTPSALLLADEDDPKLQRLAGVTDRGPLAPEHEAPTVKFAYRGYGLPNLDTSTLAFNALELDLYPVSARWVRVGVEAEFGWGGGAVDGQDSHAWDFVAGAIVGVQYPWRVTPFAEARFVAGLLGGDVIGQTALTWVWMGGLDVGAEVYVAGRFYLSGAIGWLHGSYNGIDLAWARAHPMDDRRLIFSGDSFTFKIGLGL